jgi:dienelactone hydrolase
VKLTRRQLAIVPVAAVAAAAPAPAMADTLTTEAKLDPVVYSKMRHDEAPRRMRFAASTPLAVKGWQRKLRTKITELLGGFPANAEPLAARVLETKDLGGFTREKIVFTSRPGMEVVSYLLKPKGKQGPLPVVLCIPGHGRGADDIVGIAENGTERTDKAGYQHDFAIQVVEAGMAALAIEPIAFGARRDPRTKSKGAGTSACQPAAGAALLLGETMIGWRVYDTMRAIDYVETRKDLDSKRVGCMGISGGGTVTLFASALDMRIQAAMVSGYLNTFRDSILAISHCMDNYVPGILNWAEMSDVAGLIAPRPFFAESGERDSIFPIAAANQAFAEVKKVYAVLGAEEKMGRQIFDDVHVFNGAKGIPWLAAQL